MDGLTFDPRGRTDGVGMETPYCLDTTLLRESYSDLQEIISVRAASNPDISLEKAERGERG